MMRAYSQASSKCAEQFSSKYKKRFTQHHRTTLLALCEMCWLFHPPTQCQKPKVCSNYSSHSHGQENYDAHLRCVGYSGPHKPGSPDCFALLKHTAHSSRALSNTEHHYATKQGKAAHERWDLSQQRARSTDATQATRQAVKH